MIAQASPISEIEMLPTKEWAAKVVERAHAGLRPVTLYGRRDDAGVVLTVVHQDAARLQVSRTTLWEKMQKLGL